MELIIIISVVLIAGAYIFIQYDLKRHKLVQSMKIGQIWREYGSKEPENPWEEREYTDYEIIDIKTSKKGNLWIRYKIVDTDTLHHQFIGNEYSCRAYYFVYIKDPMLIKDA